MIAELFEIQKMLEERSRHVGRLLQTGRHYLMEQTAFPAVSPFWTNDSNMQYTGVVIGRNAAGGYVIVYIPTPIFENSTDAEIRVWIAGQNAAIKLSVESQDIAVATKQKDKEITALRELMAKYPEEVK